MKKVFYLLAVFTMLFVLPLSVYAADPLLKPSIPDKEFKAKDNGDGTTTKTYTIYMTFENFTANGLTTTEEPLKFSFEFGPAIKSWKCLKSDEFGVVPSTADKSCSFKENAGVTISDGKKTIGYLEIVQDNKFDQKDCWIEYTFNTAKFKINPATGASLPYLFIIGGVIVGSVLYFATKKNNKLIQV
ncbi:MAG: LPXTG cell wall anchor domain-containing protein [Mollicutes bacterium]|nr:LPXTG cell wall anchor domain-containing protein [Mollicutes bacterium]